MGRRNKAYFKDLHQQAYDRLTGMQAFGESKKEAVANGTEKDKIFAFNTYKSYWKHTKYFIKYIKDNHPAIIPREMFIKSRRKLPAGKVKSPPMPRNPRPIVASLPANTPFQKDLSAGTAAVISEG